MSSSKSLSLVRAGRSLAIFVTGGLLSGCLAPCPPCQTTSGPASHVAPASWSGGGGGQRASACPGTAAGVFDNEGFTGRSAALPPGRHDLEQLEAMGIENDSIRSVCVAPGCTVTLHEHYRFEGESRVLSGDTPDLAEFGGSASSITVSCAP